MDSSSNPILAVPSHSAAFVTPSSSAGNLVEKIKQVTIGTGTSNTPSTNRGVKRPIPDPAPMPATKKNRDYLPKESKPLFFDLKKQFKKKSQWTAHQRFMQNCADSGNYPRSLRWKCTPPWSFNNADRTQKWATVQQTAPAELCQILAQDCEDKKVDCDAVIQALLTDLQGLVPETDFLEIQAELKHDYHSAVDRLYAEKILGRTTAAKQRTAPASTSAKPGPKTKQNLQPRASGRPKSRKRFPSRTRRNAPQQPNTNGAVRSRPAANKQELMRQLNDLTKAIKKMQ